MTGNLLTPTQGIKVYPAFHASQSHEDMKRMERVIESFNGTIVPEPAAGNSVWLSVDPDSTYYRDFEWKDDYVLCCGPNSRKSVV